MNLRRSKWLFLILIFISCNLKKVPRETDYKIFTISQPTYAVDMIVIITEDIPSVIHFIQENTGDTTITPEDFKARGVTFTFKWSPSIMWMPRPPKTEEEYATAIHELFHLTVAMMNYINAPLTDSTEEIYAYVLGDITEQFLKGIR